MDDRNRGRSRREGAGRPPFTPRGRGPGAERTAEEMLELADELEEAGRAMIGHARQLQRMAERMERGEPRDRPERGARPSRSSSRPGGEGRERKHGAEEGGESRPRKRTGDAPAWVPAGKRRRSS